MFVSLLLSLATSPSALAAEPAAELADSPSLALVGDEEAVGKKRGGKSGKGSGSSGSADRTAERDRQVRPDSQRAADSRGRPAQGRSVDTERDGGRSAERASEGRERESRQEADRGEADRRRSRDGGERHEAADRQGRSEASASAGRHASAGHEAARHRSATRHKVRSHEAAGRHAPAYRAAARHRAAAHTAAAHHRAAWSSRHHAYRWYSPWAHGRPHHWYHGVFVYGPSAVVVNSGGGGSDAGGGGKARGPRRDVDRNGDFSIGVQGGSYLSGFGPGEGYGDAGLGLNVRYRPIESLGFEAAWTYHDASWSADTSRIQQPLQVSAQVFAFPWTRVSPYVLAGVTVTDRNIHQPLAGASDLETDASLWGPHAGVGIEFALGENVGLDFDARFIGYVNKPASDPSAAGAFQGNMGLNFYF